MVAAIGRRSSGGRGGRPAFHRRRRSVLSVKTFLNRTKPVHHEQACRAARLISVKNRLTLPSHSVPSVRLATLPVSEKPAASAKSWYLLSSCGSPRPRANHGLKAGRGPPPNAVPPPASWPQARRRGSTLPPDPRLRVNDVITGASRRCAGLHTGATLPGQTCYWLLSLASDRLPHTRVCPKSPCTRPRPPAGPRPFNRPGGPPRRFTHLCPGDAAPRFDQDRSFGLDVRPHGPGGGRPGRLAGAGPQDGDRPQRETEGGDQREEEGARPGQVRRTAWNPCGPV